MTKSTKSTKPETPIYNWALRGRHRNIVAATLFDSRADARKFLNTEIAADYRPDWMVVRVAIYVMKGSR